MKFHLKRSNEKLTVAFIALIAIVAINIICWEEVLSDMSLLSVIGVIGCIGTVIYEYARIRTDKFFFDEEYFYVCGKTYQYSEIDFIRVYASSSRYSRKEIIEIYIGKNLIFGFDKQYENADKFIEFANKQSVEIKIGLYDT